MGSCVGCRETPAPAPEAIPPSRSSQTLVLRGLFFSLSSSLFSAMQHFVFSLTCFHRGATRFMYELRCVLQRDHCRADWNQLCPAQGHPQPIEKHYLIAGDEELADPVSSVSLQVIPKESFVGCTMGQIHRLIWIQNNIRG